MPNYMQSTQGIVFNNNFHFSHRQADELARRPIETCRQFDCK